ncbi:ribonuclease HI [Leifsonia sp. Leaf264]|uniref:ribonuclease HI n=1 Tax=Leifsonia sp. Leaf264 TaxID=1736314 RepID=UPI0006FABC17|nr:RNase H family protein [Leifsonia sp. Leaf264]KQO98217.1 hypothetical protein ASF30_09150 [Leifsonia sp. Leaf264]
MLDDPNVPQRQDRNFTLFSPESTRIVGATDGAFHPQAGGAAYGWMTEDGARGFGPLGGARSALAAEIGAVKRFLRVNKKYRSATIYMDSKRAIEAITDARNGLIRSFHPLDVISELNKVVDASRTVDLDLRWVRGHNNHPLNDAADRLARLARQTKNFRTSRSTSEKIADEIVAAAIGKKTT